MKINHVLPWVATLLSLSACSQSGNVALKTVDLSTSQVGAETYINMDAVIAMGSLKFPMVEIPVVNPTNMQILGQMSLSNLPDGTNRLMVSIDYNAATNGHLDPKLGLTLPNQRELPLSLGIDPGTAMIGIPILDHSRIYIGGDLNKNIYIGAAIAVSSFDSVLGQIPFPLNIFYGFPFSNQISGYAGLFTGTQAGQNGVGIFVKKIAAPATPVPGLASGKMMLRNLAQVVPVVTTTNPTPTGGEELGNVGYKTLFKLDRMLKKRATIRVH